MVKWGAYMGFLDSLIRSGTRAITNAVSEVVADAVSDALRGDKDAESKNVNRSGGNRQSCGNARYAEEDNRSFDEKLIAILENAGNYEVRRNISPDELEAEVGTQIYTRSNNYCKPAKLTYGIYKDGQRVLFINLWDYYPEYKHEANRQIKRYCDKNGIKMLDFFDYMPNAADYMEERIRAKLV